MSIEWSVAILFFMAPIIFMLAVFDTDEDDDGPPDGGIMQPVFEGA